MCTKPGQLQLRRLARGLVSDESGADDVVQQTWLEALERPPAEAGNLRAWLGIVAGNLARKRGLAAKSRLARERVCAAREPLPSSAELAEKAATRHMVAGLVLEGDRGPVRPPRRDGADAD